MDSDEDARRAAGYERVKAEIRAGRVAMWGEWAADDAEWERVTGQRWPSVAPIGLIYDEDDA